MLCASLASHPLLFYRLIWVMVYAPRHDRGTAYLSNAYDQIWIEATIHDEHDVRLVRDFADGLAASIMEY